MRVLVTGSVDWTDPVPIKSALDDYLAVHPGMIVLTGLAEGADEIARQWANENSVQLWAEPLAAGRYPGPMHRYNERMLTWEPDVVIVCKPHLDLEHNPDAGTEHMCLIAMAAGVRTQHLAVTN